MSAPFRTLHEERLGQSIRGWTEARAASIERQADSSATSVCTVENASND